MANTNSIIEQFFSETENLAANGNLLEAEKQLQAFIDNQDLISARVHNDLGVISHQLERFEHVGRLYREAVRLAPENITFRKNLADFIFVIEKLPQEAMFHYNEILKRNPRDPETLLMIGNICLALGVPEEARVFFSLVLEIEPWNIEANSALEMFAESKEDSSAKTDHD
ncbi:MAG: hypothetical protein JXR80_08955 [Deltaproteobacteria bacterium]|nr:hypothetical protein [Deltaproteobacteria bacterium]